MGNSGGRHALYSEGKTASERIKGCGAMEDDKWTKNGGNFVVAFGVLDIRGF
jgi:hypothetical protein